MAESSSLYADRPEWADITPIPQYPGGTTPLAPIFYTEQYQDATDYFRGVVKVGELSERVLELTEDIIRLNPAHYSVWQYRWKTIVAIGWPLDEERRLMDELATKYLKNYQVWHHRRLLLTALKTQLEARPGSDPEDVRSAAREELDFIAKGLQADTKNYHTWAYRQWILAYFGDEEVWKEELPWVEELLGDDVRNNSAWHHRFFVVWQSGVRRGDEDREATKLREIRYAKQAIGIAPNNPSAWNYLRGVLDLTHTPYASLQAFVVPYAKKRDPLATPPDEEIDLEDPRPGEGAQLPCTLAIEFLAEVLEVKDQEGIPQAVKLYESLAREHDIVRKKYWEHRIKEAQHALQV